MDAETKHTPGPWKLERSAFGVVVPIIINDAGEYVGEAGNDPDKGYENAAKTEEQGLANARLIAASPDLLDATRKLNALLESMQAAVTDYLQPVGGRSKDRLISLIVELQDGKEQREAQIAARAAIAKATVTP